MEAGTRDGAQSLPADAIARRDKDTNSRAEQLFEVSTSIGYPLRELIAMGELPSIMEFIVIIPVQHDLKVPLGNACTEVVDKRLVLV